MGTQESKQQVQNEQIIVNAGLINADAEKINSSWGATENITRVEIFGISVLAVVMCVAVAKIMLHYVKKAVRAYQVNTV
jgi:hypothetical protein